MSTLKRAGMKKWTYILIIFLHLFFNAAMAQNSSEKKDQIVYSMYYGTNFSRLFLEEDYSTLPDYTIASTGNFGAVLEEVTKNKIGLGLELGYFNTKVSYSQLINTGSGKLEKYSYSQNYSRMRVQLRMNFYFVCNPNFHAYSFFAVGYSNYKVVSQSNAPDFINSSKSTKPPIGIKTGVGFRYFGKSIGIFTEIAIGTPLLNIGTSIKL